MTIKEQIAEKLRAAGYDLLTALELATDSIREFNASCQTQATYYVVGKSGKGGKVEPAASFVLKKTGER